jgi:hypothetical protein
MKLTGLPKINILRPGSCAASNWLDACGWTAGFNDEATVVAACDAATIAGDVPAPVADE